MTLKSAVKKRTLELEASKQSLLQSKQLAEEANATKSHFLENMSHDIRTPMNGVLGMLELLEDAELKGEYQRFLQNAQQSAKNLLNTLHEVLDLSQIEADTPDLKIVSQKPAPSSASQKYLQYQGKVLVAEDCPLNQLVVEKILNNHGLEVEIVGNGHEAVKQCLHVPYDLVLMDIQMPEMDGLEATRQIRRQKDKKKLPIVAFTGHATEEYYELCMDVGMNDYITKPLKRVQLSDVLKKFLPELQSSS